MSILSAPFPWPGNKAKVAPIIVTQLLQRGPVAQYIEPFAGGLAVMLAMPTDCYRIAGDADGVLVNIWRAIMRHPDAVADAADIQVSGAALVAAQRELAERERVLLPMLASDLGACDARAAGLRLFAMSAQINGSWTPTDPTRAGMFLSTAPRLRPSRRPTTENLRAIAAALRGVKVFHGDWTGTLSSSCLASRPPRSIAVLLDPPYSRGNGAYRGCSTMGEPGIACAAATWAREHPDYRVALCGTTGEHDMPGWAEHQWVRAYKSGTDRGESIWFSPGCGQDPIVAQLEPPTLNWLEELED